MASPPTAEQAAARVNAAPDDETLVAVLAAALQVQASALDVTDLETDLDYQDRHHEAALRRVAFLWSSIPHHLGVTDNGYGLTQYLPMYHPDWDMLEQPPVVIA